MNELLNIQNVSIVGVLMVAIVWLVKTNAKNIEKQDKANDDKISYIKESFEFEKQRHNKEEQELKGEIKFLHKNYLERMDKFDNSLNENTKVLKEVSENVKDIKEVKKDVEDIKEQLKFNGGK